MRLRMGRGIHTLDGRVGAWRVESLTSAKRMPSALSDLLVGTIYLLNACVLSAPRSVLSWFRSCGGFWFGESRGFALLLALSKSPGLVGAPWLWGSLGCILPSIFFFRFAVGVKIGG